MSVSKNNKEFAKKTKTSIESLSSKDILNFYREMLLVRRFEEKAGQLYGMGLIAGFCHLYIGQEAISSGMRHTMIKGDKVITTYRDHGHMITAGSCPKKIMAELMGRRDGSSKGKGGSMHLFDIEKHFYGGHGIVGASVPIGAGLAFADKYLSNNNVTYCYFGDGAAHQGQVYEAFNMAKLWDLPVLFIIENNQYAMGTSLKRASSIDELYKRGIGFNIPGKKINGMDIFSVIEEGQKAVDFVRSGNGPMILEMDTYRYRGHSMSDPATYRSKEELNCKKEQDPIENLRNHISSKNIAKEEEIKAIENDIKNQITDIVEFAKNSPEPDESELMTEIYV
ncbi:MAG: pyruvate dehydrogenase (acetyl-transferring) E1 component subunit alpha [Rickettsiales bacterium]|nr:pyruvate dehydrogenase (acetyl-transferring) E1 component subunit alpha [Rickettsiales bacterium]